LSLINDGGRLWNNDAIESLQVTDERMLCRRGGYGFLAQCS
jgi:hypothetical protein